MSGDATEGFEAQSQRFSKKVPATSVAPTYKLTLPAEVVCEALPHLIEKDFELVDTTGQHVWSVSILPRKNKDKFEYTLQGWRAFAEEQGVRTGDQLDFTLLEERRLQISLTRRAVLEQQHLADGFPATPDVPGQHGKSSTSSDEGQLLQQLGTPSGLPKSGRDHSTAGGSLQGDDLSLHADQMLDILELGHDPMDEALSPQLPLHPQGSMIPVSAAEISTPRREPGRTGRLGGQGPSLPSSASAPVWIRQESSRGKAVVGMPKRQRISSLIDLHRPEAAHHRRSASQERPRSLELRRTWPQAGPSSGAHQMFGLQQQQLQQQQQHLLAASGQHRRSGTMAPEAGLDRGAAAEMSSVRQEVERLKQALQQVHLRAARAEGEAATLMQVLGSAEGILERQTARGLATVSALFNIAGRVASPDLLRFVDPPVAQELSMLQSELKHHTDGVLDALWHMRNLTKHDAAVPAQPQQRTEQGQRQHLAQGTGQQQQQQRRSQQEQLHMRG